MHSPFLAPRRAGARLACAALALLAASAAHAQSSGVLAGDSAAQEEPYGWPWLVRALDRLKPSVDTSLPETPTQVAERLENMINQGETTDALREIEALQAKRAASNISGIDARLLFLQARALAAQGEYARATEIYRGMTVSFPELPEPWNNLAALYAAQGQLDRAREALEMALRTHPGYAAAQANLADVYLMLAERAYGEAARMGVREAAAMENNTRRLIRGESQ